MVLAGFSVKYGPIDARSARVKLRRSCWGRVGDERFREFRDAFKNPREIRSQGRFINELAFFRA